MRCDSAFCRRRGRVFLNLIAVIIEMLVVHREGGGRWLVGIIIGREIGRCALLLLLLLLLLLT